MPSIRRELLATSLVVYLGVVAAITIVPTHLSRIGSPDANRINVIPFGYSFKCFRDAYRTYYDLRAFCLRNTLGNIALFLPLGILLPFVSNCFRRFKQLLLFALCLSVGIEATQFALRFVGNTRSADIDDVILNTLGACLGFLLNRYVLLRIASPRQPKDAQT